jgi:hypothetical protein
MAALLKKPVAWLVLALVVLAAAGWLYSAWTARPKAEARLGRNTTEAAQASPLGGRGGSG